MLEHVCASEASALVFKASAMCTVTRTFWLLLLGVQVRSRTAFASTHVTQTVRAQARPTADKENHDEGGYPNCS